jgi:hypothetical protein
MPIWDGAIAVLLERSSDGQTSTVLGAGDAVLASCDDAGTVAGPDGSALMTATFSMPRGAHSGGPGAGRKRLEAKIEVADAAGAPSGTVDLRSYKVTPLSKKMTLALVDTGGTDVGEVSAADRKGRELVASCGGSNVVSLALAERDRSLRRTVERWSLTVHERPAAPADLLAAAAILRYGKLLAEVAGPPG